MKKHKEIVWIFGNSAAGKETFARYIVNNQQSDIAKKLGWSNQKIVLCVESIACVGQFDNDPIVGNRKNIPQAVQAVIEDSEVVLIKWQFVDSLNKLPENLMELFPRYRHRIILLQTSNDEYIKRLPKKKVFKTGQNPVEIAERERPMVAAEISKLADKYNVTILDSSHYEQYSIVTK